MPRPSRAQTARQLLTGTAAAHADNAAESALDPSSSNYDAYAWEWIYASSPSSSSAAVNDGQAAARAADPTASKPPPRKRKAPGSRPWAERRTIVGARKGGFECAVGDAVLVNAGWGEAWVALVHGFVQGEDGAGMRAVFMWFSHPREIRDRRKRREDELPNEIYVNAIFDENPLETIDGRAEVVSLEAFKKRYPSGKIPKNSKDFGKLFVCRRGCNTRTATFTDEFRWEDVYRGAEDLESLKERIEAQTKATRKKKGEAKVAAKELEEFVAEGHEEDGDIPKTPRKKRKTDASSTPKSKTPRKFTTPTSKRIIPKKPLEFTPLGTRVLSPAHIFSSPFQIARSQLHVSSVPESLPCREEEFSTVYSYLESAITEGTGSCIYIHGTPGTGKTATVREVVAQLNASVQAEELDDFIFVEINGMKVTDPHQSYSLLWEALTGDRLSPTHALSLLEREFSSPSPRRVPCVVLMDELDQLVTKNQSVMYNFFNWPNLPHSRLIVLAVANTMDLPERTLSNKISSRLGLTRIPFPSYSHDQLIQIIRARLSAAPSTLVDPDAIEFASRKVAQVSGDARRALDICRRAVELAEAASTASNTADPSTPSKKCRPAAVEDKPRVTIATVRRAISEATTSPLATALRALPPAGKLFLAALRARVRRTGVPECALGEVVEEARRLLGGAVKLAALKEFVLAGGGRVAAMGAVAAALVEAGLVLVETRRGERGGRVRCNVGEEEVMLALKDDEEARGLIAG